MEKKRLFIAIQLPPNVRTSLGAVSDNLAAQMPERSVRWVKPDLLHLTLRFLGDTAVDRMPALGATLDEVAAAHAAFALSLGELGCFPNRSRPRVIWVGLHGDLQPMQALKRALDETLAPLGWEKEDRPFRAHLTLGRVKDSRLLKSVRWGTDVQPLPVPITAVHLVESQLTREGPVYTVRHSSDLRR